MNILTVDPGLATGVAYMNSEHDAAPLFYEITGGLAGFIAWFHEEFLPTYEVDALVVENWSVRPNTYRLGAQPDAYLILGYVQGWCLARGTPCAVVMPATHKSFNGKGRQSKVQRLGWGERSTDDHADDACSLMLSGLMQLDRPAFVRAMEGITDNV